jgi:DNA polymerase
MRRLHIDIETQSELDLSKVGVYKYAEHHSTRITFVACALDDGPVSLPVRSGQIWPVRYRIDDIELAAHNAEFERVVLGSACGKQIGFPQTRIDQWVCTASKASVHALPRALEKCAIALGLANRIDPTKRANMLSLAKPNKAGVFWTPETQPQKFEQWGNDCMADVEAEREIDQLLPDLIPSEKRLYVLDQVINQRGFAVDVDTAIAVCKLRDEHVAELVEECMKISGFAPSQRAEILNWLTSKGVELKDYTAKTIKDALDGPHENERVLQIRRETGKTSVAKFDSLLRTVCADGRIRGSYLFHGASPGRWTGKGFQPHNIAKPTIDWEVDLAEQLKTMSLATLATLEPSVMDALSSCGRPMIIGGPGRELIATDFSSVESRITAWLCDEQWKLDVFRGDGKIYEAVAARMFKKPVEFFAEYRAKTGKHHAYRDLGKRTELMCGYAGGLAAVKRSPGFEKTGATDEEVLQWVALWREACPRTKGMWKGLERLIANAIESGQVTQGYKCRFGLVTYANGYKFLKIQLPSGRGIFFANPKVDKRNVVWSEELKRYVAYNPDAHKDAYVKVQREIGFWQQIKEQWVYDTAHGGIFLQNIVEGVGRDLLKSGMLRLDAAGYEIVGHTHDEAFSEVDYGTRSVAEHDALMCELPIWAGGLPMNAAGYRHKRYHKDE